MLGDTLEEAKQLSARFYDIQSMMLFKETEPIRNQLGHSIMHTRSSCEKSRSPAFTCSEYLGPFRTIHLMLVWKGEVTEATEM